MRRLGCAFALIALLGCKEDPPRLCDVGDDCEVAEFCLILAGEAEGECRPNPEGCSNACDSLCFQALDFCQAEFSCDLSAVEDSISTLTCLE